MHRSYFPGELWILALADTSHISLSMSNSSELTGVCVAPGSPTKKKPRFSDITSTNAPFEDSSVSSGGNLLVPSELQSLLIRMLSEVAAPSTLQFRRARAALRISNALETNFRIHTMKLSEEGREAARLGF